MGGRECKRQKVKVKVIANRTLEFWPSIIFERKKEIEINVINIHIFKVGVFNFFWVKIFIYSKAKLGEEAPQNTRNKN